MNTQTIIDYYDYTIPFYRLFWHKGTNALHYGIWHDDTKTLQEALINTNEILCDMAHISEHDVVLDAGCGVGGSALWLAKHTGIVQKEFFQDLNLGAYVIFCGEK